MTKIPEDHEAARALKSELERLGRERGAAWEARSGRRRRRAGRIVFGSAAAALAAAVVATATTSVFDPAPTREAGRLPPALERAPSDARLSDVRVPDPAGGPPWGARLYTSEEGLPCVDIGRLSGGRLGVVRDGTFVPFGDRAPGACATARSQHLVIQVRRDPGPDAGRSILYGLADRAVAKVALERRGRRRRLRIAPDGVILRVRRGVDAFAGVTLVTRVAGRTRRSRLLR